MGTRKSTVARILILGCAGLFCLGGSFTWVGGNQNIDWDNANNWTGGTSFGEFPDDTNDDALFPVPQSGTWVARLVRQGPVPNPQGFDIDDLTIEHTTAFQGASGNPVLTADTLTIKGGALTETVVGIVTDGVRITARGCP